jgi:hypothetical protein
VQHSTPDCIYLEFANGVAAAIQFTSGCHSVATGLHACTQNGLLLGIPIVFDTDREDINVGDKVLITYK